MSAWWERYWTAENLCGICRHPRNSHLGQAPLRGALLESDAGWCTLAEGTCIFGSCSCREFVEPEVVRLAYRGLLSTLVARVESGACPRESELFVRAGGGCVCGQCGAAYWQHAVDSEYEWLHRLCDGRRVKL